jgi:hypothetical protein
MTDDLRVIGKTEFPNPEEVKALSPRHRLTIALHSPEGIAETGLHMCPPEKSVGKLDLGFERDTFSCAVSNQNLRNCGDFLAILAVV